MAEIEGMARCADNQPKPDDPATDQPDFIAENLRKLYRSTEAEPLPDMFRSLLAQLGAEDSGDRE